MSVCLSSGNIRYLGDFSSDFMLKDTETFFRCFIGLECLYTKEHLSMFTAWVESEVGSFFVFSHLRIRLG